MLRIQKQLNESDLDVLLLLQVHDELVLELPLENLAEISEIVRKGMEGALKLDIPLLVDMNHGSNWSEAH